MTPRTVAILFVLALVAVTGAVVGTANRVNYQSTDYNGQKVFPKLLENAADVGEVAVLQNGVRFNFVRQGEQWTLQQSDGYPVHGNLISKIIFSLSNMELLEAKTKLPARHSELNLGDPAQRGSASQQVTLKSKSGDVMADVILGHANYFLPETTTGGMYIRRPGEDQTWLAKGLVDVGVEPRDFLVRDIIDIRPENVTGVEVQRPDGGQLIVAPDASVTGGFTFANLPADMKLKSEYAPRNIAAILGSFVLNDVRASGNVALDPAEAYRAVFTTALDITATLLFWQKDEKQYLRVNAEYVGGDPASDAAKQAAAINARTDGWTYIIPEYQYEQVSKSLDDVAEKIKPAS